MAQETNQSQAPLLCTTGCGFYGNPRKNGMCSVCYKDFLQRQNGNMRVSIPESSPADSGIGDDVVAHCPSSSTATVATEVPAPAFHTDTDSGQSSSVSSDSGEECTSGAEARLKTEDLPAPPSMQGSNVSHRLIGSEAGAVVASVQQDQLSAAGSSAGRLSSRLAESPRRAQLARKCKRKVDAPAQSLAGKQAKLSEDSSQAAVESEEKPNAKRNRCFTCRKKIGLTGFDCRCGNVFCGSHRYSDMHECTFDYKADAVEKIRKENPVVVGEKIQKI